MQFVRRWSRGMFRRLVFGNLGDLAGEARQAPVVGGAGRLCRPGESCEEAGRGGPHRPPRRGRKSGYQDLERSDRSAPQPSLLAAQAHPATRCKKLQGHTGASGYDLRRQADQPAIHLLRRPQIEADLPDIPLQPQIWTSDATPERLGTLMADQGECMAWLSSEGGVFDLLQGRYSNGIPNLDLVLKSHSGDSERVDRGSRPAVFLKHPRLGVGLSPQLDVLRGLAAKPGFRGRGLLARFLYLLPPSPLGFRPLQSNPVAEGVRNAYAAGIGAMLDWEPDIDEHGNERPRLLHLSDEAFLAWRAFARAIEVKMQPGGELEHFTDWAGKAPGAAARLAGVLHGITHAHGRPWETAITAETMTAALEIMAVIGRHSLAALDMMRADPTIAAARLVWDRVERGRLARFTVRDAFNALRGTFPRVSKLREALEALEERGYVEVIEPPRDGPGRPPSPLVLVRPEIARAWQ